MKQTELSSIAVYNTSMLRTIKEMDGCTVNELRAAILPPKQPGVIQLIEVSFNDDLKDLEKYGAIEIKGDHIKYIGEPRSLIVGG